MESHKIAVLALEKLSGAGHGGLHDSKEKTLRAPSALRRPCGKKATLRVEQVEQNGTMCWRGRQCLVWKECPAVVM